MQLFANGVKELHVVWQGMSEVIGALSQSILILERSRHILL